ncbi:mitochondrial carrier domain-containing protein [Globomyces pollinis-pini]|nr:mitochondrial carrier domain-containing protein [Globomyces pollinis-pini]
MEIDEGPKRISLSDMDSTKYMIFGSLFILGVDTMLFPLDTLKTIVMSERSKKATKSPNLFKLALNIAQREGVPRFWRGIGPSTLGNFPGQASYYLAYESSQEFLSTFLKNDQSKSVTFLKGFLSGMAAEVAGGMFYVPADIVAQRLQVQSTKGFVHNHRLYKGPLDIVKRIYTADGVHGLYRGYGAYVSAYAPGSAIQWGSYELSKMYMYRALSWMEQLHYIPDEIPGKEQWINALSAGIAGICSVSSNNPLEVLRIRTQLLESGSKKDADMIKGGYFQLARMILREEGWKAFYRGLRIRLLVTVPSSMVALSGYEVIKKYCI